MDAYQFPDFSFCVNLRASRYLQISPGRFIPLVLNSVSLWLSKRWYGMDPGDLWHEPWWNQSSNRWGSRPGDNLAPRNLPMTQRTLTKFPSPLLADGWFSMWIFWDLLHQKLCILLCMQRTWNLLLIPFFFFWIYYFKSVSKSSQCFHLSSWFSLFSQSPLLLHKPPSF